MKFKILLLALFAIIVYFSWINNGLQPFTPINDRPDVPLKNAPMHTKKISLPSNNHKPMSQSLEKATLSAPKHNENNFTQEYVASYLPEPYSSVVSARTGDLKTHFIAFQNEPLDDEWAHQLESTITSFILNHNQSSLIELESVVCHSVTCELKGYALESTAWSQIRADLSKQSWWQRFHAGSGASPSHGQYKLFYELITDYQK